MRKIKLATGCFLVWIAGCVSAPPPIEEWVMARSALDAAKAVESAKHSPGNWHQAEEMYRKAQLLYRDREYLDAKTLFIKSKQAAEKAENAARLLRHKNGEVM